MVNLDSKEEKEPWPRVFWNYPIILSVIALQYIWAAALIVDPTALNVTAIHAILLYHVDDKPSYSFPLRILLIVILLSTATFSFLGFFIKRKICTILAFVPQQFVMFISSAGLAHFIWLGQFADGVVRTPAFLLADQAAPIFLTIFHTWALILIIIHAGD